MTHYRPLTENENRLIDAAYQQDYNTVYNLLQAGGIDINCQDEGGATPLMLACDPDDDRVAHLLLDHGADIHIRDETGETVLHDAVTDNMKNLVERLLKMGADPNIADDDGDTPLHISARGKRHNSMRLLLEYGANPNINNGQKHSVMATANLYSAHRIMAFKILKEYEASHVIHECEDFNHKLSETDQFSGNLVKPILKDRIREKRLSGVYHMADIYASVRKDSRLPASHIDLIHAAYENQLPALISSSIAHGNRPSLNDFLKKDIYDVCLLDVLKRRNEVHLILRDDLWCGREDRLDSLFHDLLKPWQKLKYKSAYGDVKQKLYRDKIKLQQGLVRRPKKTNPGGMRP